MLRIVTFVAILTIVRMGASSSERAKLLEDPKGTQINTKDLFLKQEKERAVNGNENLSLVDLSKKAAEGFEGTQDEFDEENEIDPDDIQDDSDVENEIDPDDIQDNSDVENDSDSDDIQDEPDEEGDDDSDDIQDNSNEEDESESDGFQNDFATEHVVGNSLESSLSQLNDMIKKANPGLPEEASKRSFEDKDMIDGDIKLDEESAAELVDFYKRNPQYLSLDSNVTSASLPYTTDKRKVIKKRFRKWKMPIRYKCKTGPKNRAVIKQAIRIWERETCIRFKEKKSWIVWPPKITFRGNKKGCWAHIGKLAFGNTVNLGKGCQSVGIALHEIGHTLGFYHEQSRPDRNKYVIIKKGNIQKGKIGNFLIRSSTTYGTNYDYGSIMHYRETAFAKKSGSRTIISKQRHYGRTMGQRIGLSFDDIKAANFHYCQKRCKGGLKWSKCKNGGYRNPKKCTRCKCPDGWTGKYCTVLSYSRPHSTSCGNRYRYASPSYKSLESPGYPSPGYTPAAKCSWRIRAPVGRRVRLYFSSNFNIQCHRRCLDFVELRHRRLSVTGPRFCCSKRPVGVFESTGRDMLVLFRTYSGKSRKGFRAYYRYF